MEIVENEIDELETILEEIPIVPGLALIDGYKVIGQPSAPPLIPDVLLEARMQNAHNIPLRLVLPKKISATRGLIEHLKFNLNKGLFLTQDQEEFNQPIQEIIDKKEKVLAYYEKKLRDISRQWERTVALHRSHDHQTWFN